jgi:3-deoxy-D-arabino-heptulosonate 7-phosphate (DAHP) synthase class II
MTEFIDPGEKWSPSSWRLKSITQSVEYEDQKYAEQVENKLRQLPPMVTSAEV